MKDFVYFLRQFSISDPVCDRRSVDGCVPGPRWCLHGRVQEEVVKSHEVRVTKHLYARMPRKLFKISDLARALSDSHTALPSDLTVAASQSVCVLFSSEIIGVNFSFQVCKIMIYYRVKTIAPDITNLPLPPPFSCN